MLSNSHDCVHPRDKAERAFLESLVREDYERCHPGQAFDDVKRRMAFSKEDRGLYRDWLAVAATRVATLSADTLDGPFLVAAEMMRSQRRASQ